MQIKVGMYNVDIVAQLHMGFQTCPRPIRLSIGSGSFFASCGTTVSLSKLDLLEQTCLKLRGLVYTLKFYSQFLIRFVMYSAGVGMVGEIRTE